jgi:hypothetical protein
VVGGAVSASARHRPLGMVAAALLIPVIGWLVILIFNCQRHRRQ